MIPIGPLALKNLGWLPGATVTIVSRAKTLEMTVATIYRSRKNRAEVQLLILPQSPVTPVNIIVRLVNRMAPNMLLKEVNTGCRPGLPAT